HTHTAKAGALGRIAARLAGSPVVLHTFHGNVLEGYFPGPMSWLVQQAERGVARLTDGVLVLSPQQAADLRRRGIAPREKIHVIPLGMDLEHLESIASLSNLERAIRRGGRITAGWLGRFVAIKNIPLLVATVRETLRRTSRVRFVVAGDGPEAPAIRALVQELGPERFEWLGWRPDVGAVVGGGDVLLQTSRNEGTPVALIQGMAAGRPFVSTAAGGVIDMVSGPVEAEQDGCRWYQHAILAEPDPSAFASALCALAENPGKILMMGRRAAEFARARYSISTLLESVDELYSGLLARKLSPAGSPYAVQR